MCWERTWPLPCVFVYYLCWASPSHVRTELSPESLRYMKDFSESGACFLEYPEFVPLNKCLLSIWRIFLSSIAHVYVYKHSQAKSSKTLLCVYAGLSALP